MIIIGWCVSKQMTSFVSEDDLAHYIMYFVLYVVNQNYRWKIYWNYRKYWLDSLLYICSYVPPLLQNIIFYHVRYTTTYHNVNITMYYVW